MKKTITIIIVLVLLAAGGAWYYQIINGASHEFKGTIVKGDAMISLTTGKLQVDGGFVLPSSKSTLAVLTGKKVTVVYDEQTKFFKETTVYPTTMQVVTGAGGQRTYTRVLITDVDKEMHTLGHNLLVDVKSKDNIYNKDTFHADEIYYFVAALK